MSTTVDERIVSMQFDNKHFESNVQTSMSTLDKLKQKLKLDGASKGLENVSSAAQKCNVSPVGQAAETVSMKFSALQVMGVTALTNITNSAVNAGKRILSALTIDPVKAGFNEYELKIDSIKTIVNSTGRDIKDVNKLLNELNEYSDQTIYSFADMTSNIGKFTNAGVDLEDAVLAIKGISNEAAVSGASAAEASRAMYNFSQALSSGYVKLIDWKSIENANMATKEFKQQLIDTAVELNVLTKSGDDYKTSSGKVFNATQNFNDCLQEQWMTTDVLIKTLGKYADSTTDIGAKAFAAAQEVTKVTQMWDVLKETAQSGWARTWEIIVGDMNEAKAIFTPLTNFFGGIIDAMSDARNRVLEIALRFSEPWKAIEEKLGSIKKLVDTVTSSFGDIQKIVDDVWLGKFSVRGGDPDRKALLEEIGYNYKFIQSLVNLGEESWHANKRYVLSEEEIAAAAAKHGVSLEEAKEAAESLSESIEGLDDAKLKDLGLTEDEIALYRALESESSRLGISMEDLIKDMSTNNGRDMLIESFKNFGDIFVGVGEAAAGAWQEIFNPPGVEVIGIRLHGIIKSLKEFSEKLRLTQTVTDEAGNKIKTFTENGEKVRRTLKGVFAILDVVTTIVGGPLKLAFKVVTEVLKYFDLNILDVTAAVGDALVGFRDWIKGLFDFEAIIGSVVEWFQKASKAVQDWWSSFDGVENKPKAMAESLMGMFDNAIKTIQGWFANFNLGTWITQISTEASSGFSELPQYLTSGFIGGLWDGIKTVGQTIWEFGSMIIARFCDVMGIHSPSTVFFALAGFVIAGFIGGLTDGLPEVEGEASGFATKIIEAFKKFDFGKALAGVFGTGMTVATVKFADVLGNLTAPAQGVGDALSGVGEVLEKSAWQVRNVVKNFAKLVKEFKNSLKRISKAVANNLNAQAIKSLATSLLLLVGAIAILALLIHYDPVALIGAVVALGIIVGLLVVLMKQIEKMDPAKSIPKIAGLSSLILSIAGAVLALALMTKILGGLSLDQLIIAGVAMTALAGLITGLIAATKLAGGEAQLKYIGKVIERIAKALLILAITMKILATMSWGDLSKASIGLVALGGVITGLIAATRLAGGEDQLKYVGKVVQKIATALLILAIVMKILAGMSWVDMGKAVVGLAALGAIVTGLIAATKLAGGEAQLSHVGKTMMGIAGAMLILVIVAKILGGMSWDEFKKAAVGLVGLGGVVSALIYATKLAGGEAQLTHVGKAIMSIGGAMLILAITMKILAGMSWEDIGKAAVGLIGLGAIVSGLIAATRLAGGGKKLKGVSTTLMSMAVTVGILAGVALLLSFVDPKDMMPGVAAISILGAVVAGMTVATGKSKQAEDNIKAMAVCIAVMALAVGILSALDPTGLATATACLSSLMGMFAVMMLATKNIPLAAKGAPKATTTLLTLAGVFVVMAGVLVGMTHLAKDNDTMIQSATALAILMSVMAGVLGILSVLGPKATAAKQGILPLTLLAVPLVAFAATLCAFDGMKNAIPNAIALGILMTVMVGVLAILSAIGSIVGNAVAGIVALTLMVVPMLAFAYALEKMPDISGAADNAKLLGQLMLFMTILLVPLTLIGALIYPALLGVAALTLMAVAMYAFTLPLAAMKDITNASSNAKLLAQLMLVMTALLVPLTVIGLLWPFAAAGVTALTTMAVAMIAFTAPLAIMSNIENATKNADLLIYLMQSMTDILLQVSAVAPLALLGVAAITALGYFIVAMGVVATSIGALMATVPGLQDFLNVGIPVMVQLAGGIGEMIGALVSGFMNGIAASLPGLGTALGEFMTNAQPFITGAKLVDGAVLAGAGILTAAILLLTVAEFTAGIAQFLSGGLSLSALGLELAMFAVNVMPFAMLMKTVDPSIIEAVGVLTAAILMLTVADFIEGINKFLGGGTSFSQLGTELSNFMINAQPFIQAAKSVDPAVAEGVKAIADAILTLTAADILDGLTSWLTGGSDLGAFGESAAQFGHGLMKFAMAIRPLTAEDAEKIKVAAEAGKLLAEMSDAMPKEGGWWQSITGTGNMAEFGTRLSDFGKSLVDFSKSVNTLTEDDIDRVKIAAEIGKSLGELESGLSPQDGWWQAIAGEANIADFGTRLKSFGTSLVDFAKSVTTITDDDIKKVKIATEVSKELVSLESGLSPQDGWWQAIAGSQDIAAFGSKLATFGKGVSDYAIEARKLEDSDVDAINRSKSAIEAIKSAAEAVPSSGGWWSDIAGEANIKTFGDGVIALASGINSYIAAASRIDENDVEAIEGSKTTILKIKEVATEVEGIDISDAKNRMDEFVSLLNTMGGLNSVDLATFTVNLAGLGGDAIKAFTESFVAGIPKVQVAGTNMISSLVDTVESASTTLADGFVAITTSCKTAIISAYTSFYNAGNHLVQGLAKGIKDNSYKATQAARTVAAAAITAAKDALGINSPSKEFYALGRYSVDGFSNAVHDYAEDAYGAAGEVGEYAKRGLSAAIAKVTGLLNGELDTQPTIRPIMDLTDVAAGAGAINSMLQMQPSISTMSNLGAISAMAGNRQNGVESDLLSAVRDLGRSLGGRTGDTYQINGITYDDGSAVSSAVKELIRAARIERRV